MGPKEATVRHTQTMIPAPTGFQLLWEEKWLFVGGLLFMLGSATFALAAVILPESGPSMSTSEVLPVAQTVEILEAEAQLRDTLDEQLYLQLKQLQL
jgi:hypothetical protein